MSAVIVVVAFVLHLWYEDLVGLGFDANGVLESTEVVELELCW